jgi:hypothetical protein
MAKLTQSLVAIGIAAGLFIATAAEAVQYRDRHGDLHDTWTSCRNSAPCVILFRLVRVSRNEMVKISNAQARLKADVRYYTTEAPRRGVVDTLIPACLGKGNSLSKPNSGGGCDSDQLLIWINE